jgi:hypothetical protein
MTGVLQVAVADMSVSLGMHRLLVAIIGAVVGRVHGLRPSASCWWPSVPSGSTISFVHGHDGFKDVSLRVFQIEDGRLQPSDLALS